VPAGFRRGPALVSAFRRIKRVYVVGADCLDGHYSVHLSVGLMRAAELAAQLGASATIVGSSFKDSAHPDAIEKMRTLDASVRVCSRDPRSADRIRTKAKRACDTVADAAFMLRPSEPRSDEAQDILAWAAERRGAGRTLLGVNFNRQVITGKPTPEQTQPLLDAHAESLARLLSEREDLDLLFIPHDYRGDVSDRDHARILGERLDRPDRTRVLLGDYRASELKHMAGETDAVLTGRMHLAIASLGQGVPVACVTYQGKFEGLFDHFQMPPLVCPPDAASADDLHRLIAGLLDRRDELRAAIAERLPHVKAMSASNLGLPDAAA
jgi:polysaccharide pyruvyl transferase WcaK-like protein